MKKSHNRKNAAILTAIILLLTLPLVSCNRSNYQVAILITEETDSIDSTIYEMTTTLNNKESTVPDTTAPDQEESSIPETSVPGTFKPAKSTTTTTKKNQQKTTTRPTTTKATTKPPTITKPTTTQPQGQFLSGVSSSAVAGVNGKRTANKLVTLKQSGSLQASAESRAKSKSGVLYSCSGKMSASAASGRIVEAYPSIISSTKYKNYGCAIWFDGSKSYLVFLVN